MTSRSINVFEAEFVTSAPTPEALPELGLPEATFVGRSNVGKSSMIAALTGRKKLVRVSRRPGRTQAINFFRCRTSEGPLALVDLPGYGYAEAPAEERARWGPLITGYLSERAALCLIVLILDPRRRLSGDDETVLELLVNTGRPLVIAATKVDKLAKSKRKPALMALERETGARVLPFSALSGEGREQLWYVVAKACGLI